MRRRIVGGFVALALIAPACGLGDKEQQATLIRQAYDNALDAQTAVGVLSVQLEPGDRPEAGGDLGAAVVIAASTTTLPKKESLPPELQAVYDQLIGLRPRVIFDAKVALDFGAGRAKVSFVPNDMKQGGFDADGNLIVIPGRGPYVFPFPVPGDAPESREEAAAAAAAAAAATGGGEGAVVPSTTTTTTTAPPTTDASDASTELTSIWADDKIFLKRAERRPTEKRIWAQLDWTKLDEEEQVSVPLREQFHPVMINMVNTINPHFILELALGALTGSIAIGGVEEVAGVQTTRYDLRISPEKVAEVLDLDDDETALRALMFRLLRVDGDDVIENAHIWIDEEGRLRKVQMEFNQFYRRDFDNIVVISLELPELGAPVEILVPKAEETIQVERYGRMLRAGVPRSVT